MTELTDVDAVEVDGIEDQGEPGGVEFPPVLGATVHHSPLVGQATVLADQGIRAADLTSALARFLPAGVRLVEATVHAGTVMLVFQGLPERSGGGI
ncbi:hypothetical protein [Frankia tisae]|uniref:hypothetical protein n=1 Tax=Frankia tisae TaxID=2950104 RepID=UPI0021BEFC6A|nr:hypothetical protein [Frankia tisae]